MKVYVTGGTGAIGRYVVPALVRAGHEVHALARSDDKAAWLEQAGAVPSRVSLFDVAALTAAFEGQDAVANLATAIPPTKRAMKASAWAMNTRIRTEGSTAVTGAALAAGVPRLIQESIAFTYPDSGDEWVDESMPLSAPPGIDAVEVAEANAQRFRDAGRTGVVLRFGFFYGPQSAHSDELLRLARRHIGPVVGRPSGYISSIHLDDAAAAVVVALDAPAGTYNVVDDEPLTKKAYAQAVGAAVGKRPWLYLPGRFAALGGRSTSVLTRSLRVRNQRFVDATGWQPRHPSAREGWLAMELAGA